MSDEKIFKDLEGILDWVKKQVKNDKNNQFQYKSQADKNRKYLEEFLKFLNFHFETDVIKHLNNECVSDHFCLGGVRCLD